MSECGLIIGKGLMYDSGTTVFLKSNLTFIDEAFFVNKCFQAIVKYSRIQNSLSNVLPTHLPW